MTLAHRPLWKTEQSGKGGDTDFTTQGRQVSKDEVKLIRAGQAITVEGREQRQEM